MTIKQIMTIQDRIIAKYGYWQIEERKERLCRRCSFGFGRDSRTLGCLYGILPLTSVGSDCPYFLEEKINSD